LDLSQGEVVFDDDSPLSDIVVSENGVCCLRRTAGNAHVLVWSQCVDARPEVWDSHTLAESILQLVHFDGRSVIANTGTGLLRIDPKAVSTLYRSTDAMQRVSMSPDGRKLLWIEGRGRASARVLSLVTGETLEVSLHDRAADVVWQSSDAFLVRWDITQRSGSNLVTLHRASGDRVRDVLSTNRTVHSMTTRTNGDRLLISAGKASLDEAGANDEVRDSGGVWEVPLANEEPAVCVANVLAGPSLAVLAGGVLFSGLRATSRSSDLFFVEEGQVRGAHIESPIREFAVASRSSILFRGFGPRGTILTLDVTPFLSS
jgi:hypothetical protein